MQMRRLLYILLLLPQILPARSATPDVRSIAERVNRHYNNLQTLEAQFTETFRGVGIDRTESGTLWLKRPGRMRWEYRQPREKLFVTDGKTAWFYAPGDPQARRTPFKKLEDLRSPLAFLLGKTRLEKEFQSLTLVSNPPDAALGNFVLEGIPQGIGQRLRKVLLEVTPEGQIVRLVAEEIDGSLTQYTFRQLVENAATGDDKFRFTPPKGVEIVEAELAP